LSIDKDILPSLREALCGLASQEIAERVIMSDAPEKQLPEGETQGDSSALTYTEYLNLDVILKQQDVRSAAHDELLFIIQHQTSELWMKLAIHEMASARDALNAGDTSNMFKMLARVSRIFEQLNSAWDVLRTMTPADYTLFRAHLGPSSGFQSHQYRLIEYMLGNRNQKFLSLHEKTPEVHRLLSEELNRPSLYDDVIRFLCISLDGHTDEMPKPQLRKPHLADAAIQRKWHQVYTNIDEYWILYELGEKLVDLEDYFRRWRFNHVTTVERVIGFKRGTGGTSGVSYLRKMLDVELFPELWHLRGEL